MKIMLAQSHNPFSIKVIAPKVGFRICEKPEQGVDTANWVVLSSEFKHIGGGYVHHLGCWVK